MARQSAAAREVSMLEGLEVIGCLGAELGVEVPVATAPADILGLIRALCAEPPRLTWDGEMLAGALLLEVGERAGRAVRRARGGRRSRVR